MHSQPLVARFPLMAMGMLALLAGMWAGLLRLGWNWPTPRPTFGLVHGPLMISGFVGTLIGLERAVALKRRWAYAAPLFTALGAIALLAGAPHWVAPLLMTSASAVLIAVFAVVIWQQPALFTITMGSGAVTWFVGNGVWLAGGDILESVSWWVGFLVLTIAGERLELSRMVQLTRRSEWMFLAVMGVLLCGFAGGGIAGDIGASVTGVGMFGLTMWLACHDVARRTVRQTGLPRFIAVCLLSGYVWLGVGGLLAIGYGSVVAGPHYDAVLHAVLLGFVFSMIFGHAPIIFPAVVGFAVPFRPIFYAHVALLHLSVALRLLGDALFIVSLRQWGGLLNAAAIVFFLANTGRSVAVQRRAARNVYTGPTLAQT
jgi:hypothetical protein